MTMQKLLLFLLSVLCAIIFPFASAFGAATMLPAQASLNSENFPAMMTTVDGGAVFAEIVVNANDLLENDGMATMSARSEYTVQYDTDNAQPFAYAQTLADDTVNVSSGGSYFHAGKFFAPTDTASMTTIAHIAQPTGPVNVKGGGSFHVGKFHNIFEAKVFAAGHLAHQALTIT